MLSSLSIDLSIYFFLSLSIYTLLFFLYNLFFSVHSLKELTEQNHPPLTYFWNKLKKWVVFIPLCLKPVKSASMYTQYNLSYKKIGRGERGCTVLNYALWGKLYIFLSYLSPSLSFFLPYYVKNTNLTA